MQRYQQERRALGSQALITLICESDTKAAALFEQLWAVIDDFEQRFSRFLTTSELSRVNQAAGKRTKCSTEMLEILRTCQLWGEQTKGIFNPFILPRLVEAGYSQSFEGNLEARNLPKAVRVPIIDELEVDDGSILIPSDSALDLGGIGKGYLLEQLADQLDGKITDYWLSLGGDVLGCGADLDHSPWQVSVADAADDAKSVALVTLPTTGRWSVATSGINRRHGSHNGKAWHHLINPATGQPAETDIITATVIATSAVASDILASCAVILGSLAGQDLLHQSNIDDFVLQCRNQNPRAWGDMIQLPKETL